jgi:hypothetical protein
MPEEVCDEPHLYSFHTGGRERSSGRLRPQSRTGFLLGVALGLLPVLRWLDGSECQVLADSIQENRAETSFCPR